MSLLQRLDQHRCRLLVAGSFLLLALMGLRLIELPVLQRLEWLAYDQLIPQTGPTDQIDPRVVIVDINDTSLSQLGRWPWPRQQIADLLETIAAAEPALIAVDILFPEPDNPDSDYALRQALSGPNLVTAIAFGAPHNNNDSPWPQSSQMIELSPSLQQAETNSGHISPHLDADGSIRRLAPLICHTADCYPALSLAAVSLLQQRPFSYVPASGLDSPQLCIGSLCQPITQQGYQLIPYSNERYSYISAADVLTGKIGANQLGGRIVLVGTSAAGLGDLVSTPLNPLTPGVEIHARLITAWLDQHSITAVPMASTLNWLACAGLILLTFSLILTQARPVRVVLLITTITLLSLPVLLALSHYWINPVPTTLTALLALTADMGCIIMRQRRQRQRMKQAFSAYVPDVVVEALVQQGYSLEQLEAQRADVSILFADIQGFTRMTEQLEPEALVELTRLLFTEITDELQRHGGTLDKFIGDAVMAFWGAPLKDPEHSYKAVRCALAIQQRIRALQPKLRDLGYPAIQLKIGLEAGSVTAGNLGAEQRRAYTVMGEAVNAAARIEEAAGQTQAGILLGPEISRRVETNIPLSSVACFQLSGISQSMPLSTPEAALDKTV